MASRPRTPSQSVHGHGAGTGATGATDFAQSSGNPTDTSPLSRSLGPSQHATGHDDQLDRQRRSVHELEGEDVQRPGTSSTSTTLHHDGAPSRSGTLKKKGSVLRKSSLKRSGSKKGAQAGSVKSVTYGHGTVPHSQYNSVFYTPVPTDSSPTDILANRFQTWRTFLKALIAYFREVQSSYDHRSKALLKVSNVINNTAELPIFVTEGSFNDATHILRDYHKQSIAEANRARDIEEEVIAQLSTLRSDLSLKIKEIKALHGDFKNSVDKEKEATRRAVAALEEALHADENDPHAAVGREDPFVIRLSVDRQIERQIDEENYLHRAYMNIENSGRELESIVVGEVQKAYGALAAITKRDADEAYGAIDRLRTGPLSMPRDQEWAHFVEHDPHLVRPDLPLRRVEDLEYPGKNHPAAAEVRAGMLERKSKYLKSYTPGWYVLSPTHLHEFKSADRIYSQPPVMSLFLPDQKLGSHSQPGSSSHKFMLKGRQTGSMHRGHSWVFRAETYETMMAWYEDIKTLTEKTGEERNAFVRKHARSISGGSMKASSVSGDSGLEEDEADQVPYSASASTTKHAEQEEPPKRPQPGGRFPSDVHVNRHLQAPLSPSSDSGSFEDHRNNMNDKHEASDIVVAGVPVSGRDPDYEEAHEPARRETPHTERETAPRSPKQVEPTAHAEQVAPAPRGYLDGTDDVYVVPIAATTEPTRRKQKSPSLPRQEHQQPNRQHSEPVQEYPTETRQEYPIQHNREYPAQAQQGYSGQVAQDYHAEPAQQYPMGTSRQYAAQPTQQHPARPTQQYPAQPRQQYSTGATQQDINKPAQRNPNDSTRNNSTPPTQGYAAQPEERYPTQPTRQYSTGPVQQDLDRAAQRDPTESSQAYPTQPLHEYPAQPSPPQYPTGPAERLPAESMRGIPSLATQDYPAQPFQGQPDIVRHNSTYGDWLAPAAGGVIAGAGVGVVGAGEHWRNKRRESGDRLQEPDERDTADMPEKGIAELPKNDSAGLPDRDTAILPDRNVVTPPQSNVTGLLERNRIGSSERNVADPPEEHVAAPPARDMATPPERNPARLASPRTSPKASPTASPTVEEQVDPTAVSSASAGAFAFVPTSAPTSAPASAPASAPVVNVDATDDEATPKDSGPTVSSNTSDDKAALSTPIAVGQKDMPYSSQSNNTSTSHAETSNDQGSFISPASENAGGSSPKRKLESSTTAFLGTIDWSKASSQTTAYDTNPDGSQNAHFTGRIFPAIIRHDTDISVSNLHVPGEYPKPGDYPQRGYP